MTNIGMSMNAQFSSVMLSVFLTLASSTLGQELDRIELFEISTNDRRELDRVGELLQADQYNDAFDAVQRLLIRSGSRLVPILEEDGYQYHVSLADVIHARVSGTNTTVALDRYRDRYEVVASKLLKEARDQVDRARMAQISRDYPLTPSGAFATHWMAEHALAMGHYHLARWWWERLLPVKRSVTLGPDGSRLHRIESAPPVVTSPLHRHIPSSRYIEALPANPVACQVLTSILSGDLVRAEAELMFLDRVAPNVIGELAGREGQWSDLLRDQMETLRQKNDSSGKSQAIPHPYLELPMKADWSQTLPLRRGTSDLFGFGRTRVGEPASAIRGYYPACDRRAVYINDANRVRAFRRSDGAPLLATDQEVPGTIYRWASPTKHDDNIRQLGVARYAVVLEGQRLFARMGDPVTVPKRVPEPTAEPRTGIIGLDLARGARMLDGFPLTPDDHQWTFDGPPVPVGNRLFCVMRKRDSVQTTMFVACFDVNAGDLIWRRMIVSGTPWGKNRWNQITNNSLVYDAGMLFLNTSLGVVVGLRADDGGVLWATKYPRAPFTAGDPYETGRHYFRDSNLCQVHAGLIICAPADSPRIFALDATTGVLAWQTTKGRAEDAIHLYGVTKHGQLIASGDFAYWIDVRQGTITRQFPNVGVSRTSRALPAPHGVGHGVLLPDCFVWPTRDYVYCFAEIESSHSGKQFKRIPLKPRRVQSGNLIVRADAVILTTGDSLSVFSMPHGGKQ